MVTLGIISLLIALGIPSFTLVKRRSLATAVVNDLRTFAAAFEAHALDAGSWPAETDAGVLPSEVATRINAGAWQRRTPIGGQYNWDADQMHYGTRYRAVIAISSTASFPITQDVDQWLAIDRAIDNGDLYSGNFRLGADDEPIFIIAQ